MEKLETFKENNSIQCKHKLKTTRSSIIFLFQLMDLQSPSSVRFAADMISLCWPKQAYAEDRKGWWESVMEVVKGLFSGKRVAWEGDGTGYGSSGQILTPTAPNQIIQAAWICTQKSWSQI